MSGVYGDLLTFFPELIRSFTAFTAKPKTGGGYHPRVLIGEIRGIIMSMKGGDLPVENELLAESDVITFWTRKTLDKESFVSDKDKVYRRTKEKDWFDFGRTNIYILERVVGTFDTQVTNTKVDYAKGMYG